MTHEFSYHRPQTLEEALDLLDEYREDAEILSGGTDLLVSIRSGLSKPTHVVDIKGIRELKEFSYDPKNGLHIGANVTVNEMLDSKDIADSFSILKVAGSELATHPLRHRATPVGNLVTASPCGDMTSPLLCLDGQLRIVSKSDSRTLPVREFITGVKTTLLKPEEIVTGIEVPPTYAGATAGYKKLKRIKGHDLAVVAVAMIRHNNRIRIGISSAAPTPLLLSDIPADASIEDVQKIAADAISPIDDVRCTKEYRAFMVGVFIERLMKEVAA